MLGLGIYAIASGTNSETATEIPPWIGTDTGTYQETSTGTDTGTNTDTDTGTDTNSGHETSTTVPNTGTDPEIEPLAAPENLYSAAQSALTDTGYINLRNNWWIAGGQLGQTVGNDSTNDVRLDFDAPLVTGHAYAAHWLQIPGSNGRYKSRFSGAGTHTGATLYADEDVPQLHYLPANETLAFTRFGFNPLDDGMDAQFAVPQVYDLSTTDPTQVGCDVVLCLGDSNMTNAVSDFVTQANAETPYDPRIWYMPCLRMGETFHPTASLRHIPQPCIEPVQASAGGKRMSPVMALAGEIVGWSATRGRPLLMLSLGDAGSGLNGTSDWEKGSTAENTGGLMYQEMLDMITALNALGPQHEIVGAAVSLGANDTTGADYSVVWQPIATQFVSNLRSDLGLPHMPIAWLTPGAHYDPVPGETRGARMITAIEEMDQDSGTPSAIPGLRAVRPPTGNALSGANDPHFNAHGMQANGRAMGQALLSLL